MLSINSSGIVRLFGSFQDLVKPLQLHIYENLEVQALWMCIGWASNGAFLLLLHHGREDWQHQGLILWMKGCSSFVSFDWCDHHRSRVINQPATWAAQGLNFMEFTFMQRHGGVFIERHTCVIVRTVLDRYNSRHRKTRNYIFMPSY